MAYGPSELTGAVIALLEKRWVGVAEVQALLEPLPLADVARQIHFFRELKRLYRLLPVEVFGDDEQRQNRTRPGDRARRGAAAWTGLSWPSRSSARTCG